MKRNHYFILLMFLFTIFNTKLSAQQITEHNKFLLSEPEVSLPQQKIIYNQGSVSIDGTLTNENEFEKVNYTWTNSLGQVVSKTPVVTVNDEQELTLSVTTSTGIKKSFNPVKVSFSAFRVPEGISPNGDGLNDNFVLDDLAYDPGIDTVEIYDRRGVLVFDKDSYVNEFNGKNNDGTDLPAASYFYVIKLLDGQKITGWFQLIR